jgi:hypothetical protein
MNLSKKKLISSVLGLTMVFGLSIQAVSAAKYSYEKPTKVQAYDTTEHKGHKHTYKQKPLKKNATLAYFQYD